LKSNEEDSLLTVHITVTQATQGLVAWGSRLYLHFSAHAYSCRHANVSANVCCWVSFSAANNGSVITFSLIPIAHHIQFQPV
jgi:hypothetical protein